MTDEKGPVPEGWAWVMGLNLDRSTKWHYFVDHRSLCGKWMKFTNDGLEQGNDASPDNCKACRKKLEKLKGTV